MLNLTKHAVDRYREQHSGVPYGDILAVIEAGTRESAELIQALTSRRSMSPTDIFVMPLDKLGVFVIADNESVVTYLRFGQTQQDILHLRFRTEKTVPQKPVVPSETVPSESAYKVVPVLGVILCNVKINECVKRLFPDFPALQRQLFSATEKQNFGNDEREILVGGISLIAVPSKGKGQVTLYTPSEGRAVLKQRSIALVQKNRHKGAKYDQALHERYAPLAKID